MEELEKWEQVELEAKARKMTSASEESKKYYRW